MKTIDQFVNQINETLYVVIDFDDVLTEEQRGIFNLEMLDEHALTGLPSSIAKHAAEAGAGENSSTETHRITSPSNFQETLNRAMDSGGSVVVHHNGKPVAGIHSTPNYGGSRAAFKVQHAEKKDDETHQTSHLRSGTGVWSGRQKRHIPSETYTITHHEFGKGDAADRAHGLLTAHAGEPLTKDHYKANHVTVTVIHTDANRLKLKDERAASQKGIGGNLDAEKESAVRKIITKHIGEPDSPKATAEKIHAHIKTAIEAGDTRAVIRHSEDLASHVRRAGLHHEPHDVSTIVDLGKRAHGGYGSAARRYSDAIKKLKT